MTVEEKQLFSRCVAAAMGGLLAGRTQQVRYDPQMIVNCSIEYAAAAVAEAKRRGYLKKRRDKK